jgi:anti-sigma-K factor RskA
MEELRTLMKVPLEEVVQKEDFPWVWQKIEREIRLQEKPTWRQSIRSWLDVTPLFRKKVWVPAVAAALVLLVITTQIIFEKTPSYPDVSVVEYVESQSDNVLVYQLEEPKVTVIWLFEGPEEDRTTT